MSSFSVSSSISLLQFHFKQTIKLSAMLNLGAYPLKKYKITAGIPLSRTLSERLE